MESARSGYNRWLHAYATWVACATFVLIIAGALVTGNDAGLSVPDWPTSFGSFGMPRMVGGVLYEHGHRVIAATVGFLTVVLAVWLWLREPRRWVRRLGVAAVLAVVAQGVLGGLTVLFFLPVPISVGHASLAQGFFCITIGLALFTGRDWQWDDARFEDATPPSLRHLAAGTTAVVFLQLMLGAAFRHNGVGVMPHIVGAVAVTFGVAWVLARIFTRHFSEQRLMRPAMLLGGLLIVQHFLGVASYWMRLEAQNAPQPLQPVVVVTTAHVAIGALVLAASLVLTLFIYRLTAAPGRAPEIASAPQKATV